MSWETNRLLDKKHCPLFRLRLQPVFKYYKMLTDLVITFQSNGITVHKFLTPPKGKEGGSTRIPQDTAIDAGCFRNVCERLGCLHCYENFSDEEFVEASMLLRKKKRKEIRAEHRSKQKEFGQ